MKYDIVSLNASYSGMGRSLSPYDFTSEKAKKDYNKIMSYYFEYINLLIKPIENNTFEQMIFLCNLFKKFDVLCEMIVYDNFLINDAFGRTVTFLGIDVVHDMAESLLESTENIESSIRNRLNEFGLCSTLEEVDGVIKAMNHGGSIWKPCWVYRVNI